MELDWSTFILEIINFLVLVWILKRFLYRPITTALRQRQEKIAAKLDEAERLESESSALQQKYENRLQEWEREKQQARDELQEEIRKEKHARLQQLEAELADERKKAATVDERRRSEDRQRDLQNAHLQGAKFAARLLETAAGPDTEARLFELLLRTFDEMSETRRNDLRARCAASANRVTVTSAFPMQPQQIEKLQRALSTEATSAIQIEHRRDPELIAGFRLTIDALVLHLNLQDELQDFANLLHE